MNLAAAALWLPTVNAALNSLATLLLVLFVAYAAQVGHLSLRCAVCAVL